MRKLLLLMIPIIFFGFANISAANDQQKRLTFKEKMELQKAEKERKRKEREANGGNSFENSMSAMFGSISSMGSNTVNSISGNSSGATTKAEKARQEKMLNSFPIYYVQTVRNPDVFPSAMSKMPAAFYEIGPLMEEAGNNQTFPIEEAIHDLKADAMSRNADALLVTGIRKSWHGQRKIAILTVMGTWNTAEGRAIKFTEPSIAGIYKALENANNIYEISSVIMAIRKSGKGDYSPLIDVGINLFRVEKLRFAWNKYGNNKGLTMFSDGVGNVFTAVALKSKGNFEKYIDLSQARYIDENDVLVRYQLARGFLNALESNEDFTHDFMHRNTEFTIRLLKDGYLPELAGKFLRQNIEGDKYNKALYKIMRYSKSGNSRVEAAKVLISLGQEDMVDGALPREENSAIRTRIREALMNS